MMTPETQKQLKITDVSAKKLEKLNLHTAWDLVLHLPLRYEDETHIMPIKDAPIGVPCQVEGEVIHQEVTFKPRKQLIVQIADGSGSVLFLRFIHFYASNQKQMTVGKRIRAVAKSSTGSRRRDDSSQNPRCREQRFGGKPHADLSDCKRFKSTHIAPYHSDGVGRYAVARHLA